MLAKLFVLGSGSLHRNNQFLFMESSFKVFDFHRIFLGDAPPMFLLEIIFRTLIMYTYTVILLRILGKRGMGQLSMLELAIIISFGSAVGDPMVGADMPILHGIVAITGIAVFQIGLERLINRNKKVEAWMEGTANLIVENGIIHWECMKADNISKEDLFRALRSKDVEHLGQINKAFFETTGQVSVMFKPPKKVVPGLSVLPEDEIPEDQILTADDHVSISAVYACLECGNTKKLNPEEIVSQCELCNGKVWIKAIG
jgi:uncharacterized membrane protein YcaP (DUF421 family)